jgi:hypothetical protein
MPALAVLIALHWQRIPRAWYAASIVLCLPVMLLLTRICQALYTLSVASASEWIVVAGIAILSAAVALVGFISARWTRASALAVSLGLYALVNAVLAPLSGPAGHFALNAEQLQGKSTVAVPSSFNAQYERYQFLLPDAGHEHIVPYAASADSSKLAELLATHDAVVWQSQHKLDAPACSQTQPASCKLLAQRWDIKSRHRAGEINLQNLFQPEQWLLRREWLLTQN